MDTASPPLVRGTPRRRASQEAGLVSSRAARWTIRRSVRRSRRGSRSASSWRALALAATAPSADGSLPMHAAFRPAPFPRSRRSVRRSARCTLRVRANSPRPRAPRGQRRRGEPRPLAERADPARPAHTSAPARALELALQVDAGQSLRPLDEGLHRGVIGMGRHQARLLVAHSPPAERTRPRTASWSAASSGDGSTTTVWANRGGSSMPRPPGRGCCAPSPRRADP